MAGLALALGVAVPASTAGARTATAPTAPPCTSADYSLAVTVTTSSGTWSVSAVGQVDFAGDAVSASVTLPDNLPIAALDGVTVQGELVGGTVYVQVPAALSGFVGGASWVSVALPSGINSLIDGLLARGASWCANSQSLQATLSRGGVVSSLGSSSIAGRQANGTGVVKPGKKVLHSLKVPRTLAKSARSAFGKAPMQVGVWSDTQGRLAELDVSGPSISVDLQLSNVDGPVSITAPSGAVPLSPSILSMLGGLL